MPEIRRMSDSEEEVSSGHVSRNSLNASPNRELETSKHPLQNKWTLWYFKNDRAKDWESNQKQVNEPIVKSEMYGFLKRKISFTGHHFFHRGRLLGFIQSHRKCLQIGQRLRLLPFQRGHQTHVGGCPQRARWQMAPTNGQTQSHECTRRGLVGDHDVSDRRSFWR